MKFKIHTLNISDPVCYIRETYYKTRSEILAHHKIDEFSLYEFLQTIQIGEDTFYNGDNGILYISLPNDHFKLIWKSYSPPSYYNREYINSVGLQRIYTSASIKEIKLYKLHEKLKNL